MIIKSSIIKKLLSLATLQVQRGMCKCAEDMDMDYSYYEAPLPGTAQYNSQLPQGPNSAIPDPNNPDDAMYTQAWDDNNTTITTDYLNNRIRRALEDLEAGRIDRDQFRDLRDKLQTYAYKANVPYQYLDYGDASERRTHTGDYAPLSPRAIQHILNGGTFNPYQAASPAMATGYANNGGSASSSVIPSGPSYAQMPPPNREGVTFPIEQIRNAGNGAQYSMSGAPVSFQSQLQQNSPKGTYSPISREMPEYGLSSYKYVPNTSPSPANTQNSSVPSTVEPKTAQPPVQPPVSASSTAPAQLSIQMSNHMMPPLNPKMRQLLQ